MMKRLYILAFAAMASLPAMALDNIALPTDGSAYEGQVNINARLALSNSIRASVTAEMTAQADTNATTTTTAYTPRRVGDVLIGGAGANTNAAWVAKGVTTNDWVKIAP